MNVACSGGAISIRTFIHNGLQYSLSINYYDTITSARICINGVTRYDHIGDDNLIFLFSRPTSPNTP